MKLRFFTVPIHEGDEASQELNKFLGTNRVLDLERHFVPDGPRSAWAICVSYIDRGSRAAPESGQAKRIDYREVLSEADFALFAKLRALRKTMSEHESLPAYALFTNEQLATMVQQRVITLKALGEIPGVGEARVTKYGAPFLEIVKAHPTPPPQATVNQEKSSEASPR